jgi:hypothetical protein
LKARILELDLGSALAIKDRKWIKATSTYCPLGTLNARVEELRCPPTTASANQHRKREFGDIGRSRIRYAAALEAARVDSTRGGEQSGI